MRKHFSQSLDQKDMVLHHLYDIGMFLLVKYTYRVNKKKCNSNEGAIL